MYADLQERKKKEEKRKESWSISQAATPLARPRSEKKKRNSDWLPRDRVMYLYFGTRARLGPLSPSHGLTYERDLFS